MNKTSIAPFPWQQSQWDLLIDRWQNNNLPHALLFCGAKGLGKRQLALAFAKTLLCTESQQTKQACGTCRTCKLMQAGTHPDFHLIEPEEEGKNIRIDAIRELITQINQTAHLGTYKIVLLAPAEALPVAAANALLKTLEEPPAKTIFILLTQQPSLLFATIRSRCQLITFYPPKEEAILPWLKASLPDITDHNLLAKLADNAPFAALAVADESYRTQRKKFFHELKLISQQQLDPVLMAANWLKTSIPELIAWFMSIMQDLIRLRSNLPTTSITNSDNVTFIQQIALRISNRQLFYCLDELYLTKRQIHLSNPNQQLLLENLFCTWYECTKSN